MSGGRLEDELQRLRDQERRYEAEMDRKRGELEREQARGLEAFRDELKRELGARDAAARRKYDALLRDYQRDAAKDVLDAKLAMDAEYRELLRASQEAGREWARRASQMEEEARRFGREAALRERTGSDEAARSIDLAARMYARVEEMPHRFFAPNRLSVFFDAVRESVNLHKMGLNEAAAAVSISARGGIERLGCDIRDRQDEWARRFALFKARVGLLHLRLWDEILAWIRFADGRDIKNHKDLTAEEKISRAAEVDFWSRGVYRTVRRRTDEFGRMIAGVVKMGAGPYLQSAAGGGGVLDMETLGEYIAETERLSQALDGIAGLCEARCAASCQRERWGEAITRFLSDEINLAWIEGESGYRLADGLFGEGTPEAEAFAGYMRLFHGDGVREDIREWLGLVFESSAGTRAFVYIVPEEREKEVRNRILLYVDGAGEYAREIYRHVLESLNLSEEEGVAALVLDPAQLAHSPDAACRSTGRELEAKLRG